jgi:hypothetical protein
MNENNNENGNSQIPEVEELVIEDGDDTEVIKTKVAEHNQKVKEHDEKVKEANAQLYARTKKAEGFEQDSTGKWVKKQAPAVQEKKEEAPTSEKSLSQLDIIYIAKADIHEDDLEEVLNYAKTAKVSVKEAHQYLKPILDIKVEQRKTANGTNTDGGKRGSSKLSDEALLADAEKGKLPESPEDIARLASLKLKKGR